MIAEITIPDIWSMRSVLSIFGFIYLFVCLLMFSGGVMKGVVLNCGLLTVGVILLMIMTPDPVGFDGPKDGWKALEPRVFNDEGHSVDLKSLMGLSVIPRMYDKDNDRIRGYHVDSPVYAMHDPTSPDYICSPFIFHPACLVYCPGLFSLPVIVIGSLISKDP